MIPHLSPFELEIKMVDEDEMAHTSKQLEGRLTRNVILFALEDKTESIFHLP